MFACERARGVCVLLYGHSSVIIKYFTQIKQLEKYPSEVDRTCPVFQVIFPDNLPSETKGKPGGNSNWPCFLSVVLHDRHQHPPLPVTNVPDF